VIDFEGPRLAVIPEKKSAGGDCQLQREWRHHENQVFFNPVKRNWRVILALQHARETRTPVDIRCTLKKDDEVVSETWRIIGVRHERAV